MKKITRWLAALLCALPLIAVAAGTVTTTRSTWNTMNSATVAWSFTTNSYASGTVQGISGDIQRFVIVAGDATNIYAVTLTDEQSVDILGGDGACVSNVTVNRQADNADTVLPFAVNGDFTLLVTNHTAGAAATTNGTLVIYWR